MTAGLESGGDSPIEGRSLLTDDETSIVEERHARRHGLRERRRRTRALTIDVVLAAALAAIVLAVAPGLGLVLFFALPILVIVGLWAVGARLVGVRRERARGRRGASSSTGGLPPAEAAPPEAG